MSRLPLPLLFLLLAVAVIATAPFRHAQAANDLDKWNSDTGRVIRSTLKEKVNTTTYREMPNVVDAEYRSTSNAGKVLHRIEHATTQNGSKVGTTIEALKQVDKAAVAKKWANQIFKGGVRFTAGAVLIEVAMQEMLDGLDWLMTDGVLVNKKTGLEFIVSTNCANDWLFNNNTQTIQQVIQSIIDNNTRPYYQYGRDYQSAQIISCNGTSSVTIELKYKYCQSNCGQSLSNPDTSLRVSRSNLTPSSITGGKAPVSNHEPVPKQQVESKIKDYLQNSPNTSKDILIEEAYKPTGKGFIQWSDDPDSRVEIFGDTPNIAKNVYDSDNPVADGLTKTTPKFTDGTTVEGETSPNPNPESPTITDPVTGETVSNPNYDPNYDAGSSSSFSIPAFCDWASVVCDWMNWTKEEPDLPDDSEVQIEDQELINYQYSDHIKFNASCPFVSRVEVFPLGILGNMNVEVDFSYFCEIATMMKAVVIFLSASIAVMMLSYAAKDL